MLFSCSSVNYCRIQWNDIQTSHGWFHKQMASEDQVPLSHHKVCTVYPLNKGFNANNVFCWFWMIDGARFVILWGNLISWSLLFMKSATKKWDAGKYYFTWFQSKWLKKKLTLMQISFWRVFMWSYTDRASASISMVIICKFSIVINRFIGLVGRVFA